MPAKHAKDAKGHGYTVARLHGYIVASRANQGRSASLSYFVCLAGKETSHNAFRIPQDAMATRRERMPVRKSLLAGRQANFPLWKNRLAGRQPLFPVRKVPLAGRQVNFPIRNIASAGRSRPRTDRMNDVAGLL
ncbi:MAG: hypothetical protein ACK4UN_19300 [Limisphaerales bacterium]